MYGNNTCTTKYYRILDASCGPNLKFSRILIHVCLLSLNLFLSDILSFYYRPSDRVRENSENCALFWRRIVWDKKLIVQVIVRDCTISRRTKSYLFLSYQCEILPVMANLLLDFTLNDFYLID